MQNSQRDLLNTQQNANVKASELSSETTQITRELIKNTHFWIIGKNGEYFITFGRHKVSPQNFTKKWKARKWLRKNTYIVMGILAGIMVEEHFTRINKFQDKYENKPATKKPEDFLPGFGNTNNSKP